MTGKKTLIHDFYPMRHLENYDCYTLNIVAVAKNTFLPELNPFNYEIGIFGINFDYDHSRLVPVENISNNNLKSWKDFDYLFEIPPDNEYYNLLEKNFGLKQIKFKETSTESLIDQAEKNLENNSPMIVACNPYHLFYTEHYRKNPGGFFHAYHYIVLYGIDRAERKVWIYDPMFGNYYGIIPLEAFIDALEDKRGIENFEGSIYFTLEYNGKNFADINRELLMWALDYYLDKKKKQLKEKWLLFFNDFIYYFNHFSAMEFKNMLLEFGFYIFRILAIKRLHWWDFFQFYQRLEESFGIQEEMDAFKANIDKLLSIPNTLYSFTLKEKKNLKLEKLMDKLASMLDEEDSVLHSLYEKIKGG